MLEVFNFLQSPKDVIKVYESDLLIKAGAGLDDWIDQLISDLDKPNLKIVDLSKSVGLLDKNGFRMGGTQTAMAGRADPYYWLDPGNVREMVLAVHLGLIVLILNVPPV